MLKTYALRRDLVVVRPAAAFFTWLFGGTASTLFYPPFLIPVTIGITFGWLATPRFVETYTKPFDFGMLAEIPVERPTQ